MVVFKLFHWFVFYYINQGSIFLKFLLSVTAGRPAPHSNEKPLPLELLTMEVYFAY